MNNNTRILVVNGDGLTSAFKELHMQDVTFVKDARDALQAFVDQDKQKPFDITFINELGKSSEFELLKSLLEIKPQHYVVLIMKDLTPEKVLNSVKFGAGGELIAPVTSHKLAMELDKYSFLREDKRALAS